MSTFGIVLAGFVVVFVIPGCILGLALCVAARIGDDLAESAHRDEHVSSATLYPTTGRNVQAAVIDLMHSGLTADAAVARVHRDTAR